MNYSEKLIGLLVFLLSFLPGRAQIVKPVFPGDEWEYSKPEKLGLRSEILDSLAGMLGGRGCIVKDGFIVKTWGNPSEKSDWLSSVKPIFSTFLFFAVEEGLIADVHYKVNDLGWDLSQKDKEMEFFHLANMISGYARPEEPGTAFAYNDYAIQLYQKSLFDKVFKKTPGEVLYTRLGCLQFQDSIWFRDEKPRIYSSARDFARFGLFWMNMGNWNGKQVLPKKYFKRYMKSCVPENMPLTDETIKNNDDYLKIGTFGGGSAHFTQFGSGIYGFNWWFNNTGLLHPETITWPDGTRKTFMSIGAGGNNMVIVPEYQIILASAKGNWGELIAGEPENKFNVYIRLLLSSIIKNKNR